VGECKPLEPGSSPGEKRTLSLVLSYDVVAAGQAGMLRPASYCSPRHRMSFKRMLATVIGCYFHSRKEGSQCVLMTWRAVSASP